MAQKEYLKMADVFVDEVVSDADCLLNKTLGEIADFSGYKKECRYASHAINSHDELVAEVERLRDMVADWPKRVDSVDDITEVGNEILVYDGCEWAIDFVDVDVDTGSHFMANYHEVEQWMPLPEAK